MVCEQPIDDGPRCNDLEPKNPFNLLLTKIRDSVARCLDNSSDQNSMSMMVAPDLHLQLCNVKLCWIDPNIPECTITIHIEPGTKNHTYVLFKVNDDGTYGYRLSLQDRFTPFELDDISSRKDQEDF